MDHLGWCPSKALGHRCTKEFWADINDKYITTWKINHIYIPVPDFPADGLISKILFDYIREVVILTGIITDEQFLYKYGPVPRIPTVENATRVCII